MCESAGCVRGNGLARNGIAWRRKAGTGAERLAEDLCGAFIADDRLLSEAFEIPKHAFEIAAPGLPGSVA